MGRVEFDANGMLTRDHAGCCRPSAVMSLVCATRVEKSIRRCFLSSLTNKSGYDDTCPCHTPQASTIMVNTRHSIPTRKPRFPSFTAACQKPVSYHTRPLRPYLIPATNTSQSAPNAALHLTLSSTPTPVRRQ